MSLFRQILSVLLVAAPAMAEEMTAGCPPSAACQCPECSGLDLGSLLISNDKLLGIFAHSDPCFTDFISPMTNPVFFEDPRTLTEARFIYLNHQLPNALGGDNVQVMAMQARMALTEDLSIIATKDGYIVSDSPLIEDGWADVSAGLKYNLFKDSETQTILSTGFTYEMPVGTNESLQGNGDGEFHVFVSGGTLLMDGVHLVSGTGFRLPVDKQEENQMWYWSNHIDYQLGSSGIYLFKEVNWFHYMSDADAFPAPIGGHDLFNLGAVDMAGENLVTGAVGVKYKPSQNTEVGVAYEMPYSDREDVLKDRFTFDFIVRY